MLTSEMVGTIATDLGADLALIVPAALGIFAIMLGIKLLPRIIKRYL